MTEHYIDWRKSRHSEPNGDCVEVVLATDDTDVRDSRPATQHAIPQLTHAKESRPLPGRHRA